MISRQFDDKIEVVGLHLCLVRGAVANGLSALFATVYDYIAALRIRLCACRAENAAAFVRSVSRVYINVQGAEAEGAVVPRGVSKGENLLAAVLAYKAVIVFRKSLIFHNDPFGKR